MFKRVLILGLIVGILMIGFYNFFIKGWYVFKNDAKTPKEFLNETTVANSVYTKDSLQLIRQLKVLLSNRIGFFHDSFYSDSTILMIDTIVYSPMKNKLAFNVITKNPTARQLIPDRDYEWYFDAATFIGIRDSGDFLLQLIGSSFTNSRDLHSLSKEIRKDRFEKFISENKKDDYRFNLNDIRFWNSSIWKKLDSLNRP
ncbi:hypothetical protein SAMN05192529_11359 [Arachidicoccus rhizosphaerae]|uniref:Uncharacterized protein n=1 Tax=Arachidicoccus rhizosphaerae TaxID=551991 RepID=A0A1H4A5J3_9BACT|nr:hypothetical protein [Arachidicoccus rhizosphaerae]SEA30941.1 hypothetical protein SAMN05192529_11359 [Arachidicoccus rhizosphaerae]